MQKVVVPYDHDSADLSQIWMAFSVGLPVEDQWQPVLRDTIDGKKVIWVKYDEVPTTGHLWIRDRSGARRVERQ